MIQIIFPFPPVAWQRVKRGRTGFAYVPEKTRRYKQDVALWAKKKVDTPLKGPLKISLYFFMARPKNPANPYPRGDLDNYQKAIQDALNEVVWEDDSQIVEARSVKVYDEISGVGPRIVLTVERVAPAGLKP